MAFRKGYSDADVVRCIAAIRLARTADGSEFDLEPAVAENVSATHSAKMSREQRTTRNGSAL
jgi:hypothetical protein